MLKLDILVRRYHQTLWSELAMDLPLAVEIAESQQHLNHPPDYKFLRYLLSFDLVALYHLSKLSPLDILINSYEPISLIEEVYTPGEEVVLVGLSFLGLGHLGSSEFFLTLLLATFQVDDFGDKEVIWLVVSTDLVNYTQVVVVFVDLSKKGVLVIKTMKLIKESLFEARVHHIINLAALQMPNLLIGIHWFVGVDRW